MLAMCLCVTSLPFVEDSTIQDRLAPWKGHLSEDRFGRLIAFVQRNSEPTLHDRQEDGKSVLVDLSPYAKEIGIGRLVFRGDNPAPHLKQDYLGVELNTRTPRGVKPFRMFVYWLRTERDSTAPGIIVRKLVDLNTGEMVGPTRYLFNYRFPLTETERAAGLKLVAEKLLKLDRDDLELFIDRPKGRVDVQVIPHAVSSPIGEHRPGDRIARVLLKAEGVYPRIEAIANLTNRHVDVLIDG